MARKLKHKQISPEEVAVKLIKEAARTNADKLELSYLRLTTIPPEIGQLTNLKILVMQNRNEPGMVTLKTLPREILKLKNLKELDLRGNALEIPPEIINKIHKPQEILNYYFSLFDNKLIMTNVHWVRRLNEVKLLFVGQGSVGKTSLVQKLLHGIFDERQSKTDGISILSLEFVEP